MMYIEHTALKGNIHHKLSSRGLTNGTPNNYLTDTSAAALLARVREVQIANDRLLGLEQLHNSESTIKNKILPRSSSTTKNHLFKESSSVVDYGRNRIKSTQLEASNNLEEEEEYDIIQVVDSEPLEAAIVNAPLPQTSNQSNHTTRFFKNKLESKDTDCSHFIIELNEDDFLTDNIRRDRRRQQPPQLLQRQRSRLEIEEEAEDDDFEYIVTRVPKRRRPPPRPESPLTRQRQRYLKISPNLQQFRLDNFSLTREPQLHSVSNVIPIENSVQAVPGKRKRSLDEDQFSLYRNGDIGLTTAPQFTLKQYENYFTGIDSTVTPVEEAAYESVYSSYRRRRRNQSDQMGYDILNKIRKLLSFNKNSNRQEAASANSATNTDQDSQRKRRSEVVADPRQSKYRRIENHSPKFFNHPANDNDINFVPSSSYGKQQLLLNNTARSSLDYRRSKSNNTLEMSNGHALPSIDKPVARKSIFAAPQITQHLVKNTTYADIEFSDDDDDEPLVVTRNESIESRPSCSNALRSVPKVFNIPIVQRWTEDRSMAIATPLPPPSSSLSQSQQHPTSSRSCDGQSLMSIKLKVNATRPSYADVCRETRHDHNMVSVDRSRTAAVGKVSSSYEMPTSVGGRLLNGFSRFGSNLWSSGTRSIVAQEKENEERDKYRQLLEQVAPRDYGAMPVTGRNVLSVGSDLQRRRPALMVAAATSSSFSSPAIGGRGDLSGQTKMKHVPFSSTINLEDDDDDDLIFDGVIPSRTGTVPKTKQRKVPTTVIIDGDEISDIVDQGREDRPITQSQNYKTNNEIDLTRSQSTEDLKKDKLPFVEPVNSLQDRWNSSHHLKSDWYDEFQKKWLLRRESLSNEVVEVSKVAAEIFAQRRLVEAELQESLGRIQITDPDQPVVIDDFEEPEAEPEFLEFTQEQRQRINGAICGQADQVLVSKFNLNITRRDIHTLCGHNWLNDEVINFYMNLLTDRGERKNESHGFPTVYAMNTFFVPRLMQTGHAGVKRWTRKVDLFTKDVIPVPVHVGGVHWCMAIIHLKNRTIKYYDSMGTPNPNVLNALEQYLKDESMDKRKRPFDTSDFEIESVHGVPRQMNGSDCGVFSCMFAEYITRNREITFTQQNMEYFRQKMILEIVQGELLQ